MRFTKKDGYAFGVYPLRFIWHGDRADPEIEFNKKTFNYYDLEDCLRYDFISENPEDKEDDQAWERWLRKNLDLIKFWVYALTSKGE